MPKDGRGKVNAYVIVDFDGQRRRTKTKPGDLNPQWDEKLEFLINDPKEMAAFTLEVNVYHDDKRRLQPRGAFLGRVKISGAAIPKLGDQSLVYYPLEKRSVFSQIRGEIALKLSYEDDPDEKKEKEEKEEKIEKEEKKETEKEVKEEKTEKDVEEKKEEVKEEKREKEVEEKREKEEELKKPEELPAEPVEISLPVSSPSKTRALTCSESGIIRSFGGKGGGFDLVDLVPYLFVRVVKVNAPESPGRRVYAKVNVGTQTARTRVANNGVFDQVFAFLKGGLNSTAVDFSVWAEKEEKEEGGAAETSLGAVSFDLHEIPKRAPRDSPLAPQWYELTENGGGAKNDVMLATWIGTQADESFADAWHSDSCTPAMAYLSPKLWYLRLTVIQAQDLNSKSTDVYVRGQLGQQIFRTAKMAALPNPTWHEDLVFVAAEPFDQFLLISLEGAGKTSLGQAKVPLSHVRRRTVDFSDPPSEWVNLDSSGESTGKLHVRVCLEGSYHVLDEPDDISKPLGKLEVGIRGASNLGGGTAAYVVLKYGRKWIRTRTVNDKVQARWNEQYSWEVVDPGTVLTAAVFQNDGAAKDSFMGKIRIRLSTLDTNRVHVGSFPLYHVTSGGSKRTGDLELALKFSCFSQLGLIQSTVAPVLPRVHYVRPLAAAQQELLRGAAMRLAAQRLARSEPPLAVEAVCHVLGSNSSSWSLRGSKVNWLRLARCLKWTVAASLWVGSVKSWSNPTKTVFVHVLMMAALLFPELIIPTFFMGMFLSVARGYAAKPSWLLAVDPRLSCLDSVGADELEEELDSLPTNQSAEKVKARYDRLRVLAGRAQGLVGDVAAQGERIEALLMWRDQRATAVFAAVCLMAALVFYLVPFRLVALAGGCYYLRHPRFRDELPAAPVNFFRRLPSRADQII